MTSVLPLILIPAIAGALCLACVKGLSKLAAPLFVVAAATNMVIAAIVAAVALRAPPLPPEAVLFG